MKTIEKRTHAGLVVVTVAAMFAILLLSTGIVKADGYRNPPEGASALGRGGASYAYGDDITTLFHNPAVMTDIQEPTAAVTFTVPYAKTTFTAPDGTSEDTEQLSILPGLFGVVPVSGGACAVGIGIDSPYGQAMEWDKDGVFAGLAPYFAKMTTVNVNPAVGVKFGQRIALGVGLDVMRADLEFRQVFPWPVGGMSSKLSFQGDGYGIGGNASMSAELSPRQRVALSYRTPVDVHAEGDFYMDNPPPAAALPPGFTPSTSFKTDLHFPAVAALAYGVKATDELRLEANVEWVQHSLNDAMSIDIANDNSLLVATRGTTSVAQKWDDTWTVSVGADWQVADHWTLRAGWTWLPTPVPDETLIPILPESDRHILGLGLGFKSESQAIDLAYAYSITSDRTIDSPENPVKGTYETQPHLFALTYSYAF